MRFGFVTCVKLGLSCMEEIYRIGGKLDLAVTLPDERARTKSGRVYLDTFCKYHGIRLIKSPHVNDSVVLDAIRTMELDWLFIIGWSQIAGTNILNAPKKGVLGIHPTLLPIGRGRAAIPWVILKGLDYTGVTLFKLDEGVDTGPIIAQKVLPLHPTETATTLYERVAIAHQEIIAETWPDLMHNQEVLCPQDERQATTWLSRHPEDGRIVPEEMTVGQVDRLVRAVTYPYPGAFVDESDRRIRIWAGCVGKSVRSGADIYSIQMRDGVYEATHFEFEAL